MKNKILQFIIFRKFRIILLLLDIASISLAINFSIFLLGGFRPSFVFYLFANIIWLIISLLFLLYSACRFSIKYIMSAVFTAWVAFNFAIFYTGSLEITREALLLILPLMMFFILGHRSLLRYIKFLKLNVDKKEKKIIVWGLGEEAKDIAEQIGNNGVTAYKVIGFLSSGHEHNEDIKVEPNSILGSIDDFCEVVKNKKIDEVIIAFPSLTPSLYKKIEKIISRNSEKDINFKISPHLYDSLIGRLNISHISEFFPATILREVNDKIYLIYKRQLDVVMSFLGLILFLPIMLFIAIVLKFFEKGPVFYKQKRVGELGQIFTLYKFRSMLPDAEKDTGPIWADKNDKRITPFGRFLRRYGLDELPQLWNVLKGDMGLVGPRPERPYFVNNYKELRGKRLNAKPGITGLAQVSGGYDLTARHKVKYDYVYLKNCSFVLDMMILFKTLRMILSKQEAR